MLDSREAVEEVTEHKSNRGKAGAAVKVDRKAAVNKTRRGSAGEGLSVAAVFSTPGISPYDQVEWERRDASITDGKGQAIFEQKGVEVPKTWSMLATNVVSSKYFYGHQGTDEREYSVRQIVHRVARTIADWGLQDGYFKSPEDAETFYNELSFLCINQYGAFNSPVWFNCGLYHQYGAGAESCRGSYFYKPATGVIGKGGRRLHGGDHGPGPK